MTTHRDRRHHNDSAPHHAGPAGRGGGDRPSGGGVRGDSQPRRALIMALDVEPLAVEANSLLQGLAILSRVAREKLREMRTELRWASLPRCPNVGER